MSKSFLISIISEVLLRKISRGKGLKSGQGMAFLRQKIISS